MYAHQLELVPRCACATSAHVLLLLHVQRLQAAVLQAQVACFFPTADSPLSYSGAF